MYLTLRCLICNETMGNVEKDNFSSEESIFYQNTTFCSQLHGLPPVFEVDDPANYYDNTQ